MGLGGVQLLYPRTCAGLGIRIEGNRKTADIETGKRLNDRGLFLPWESILEGSDIH